MAWYALYKWFICFRKTPYINYIAWYKKYLYEQWFNSLSEEEQKKELKRQRELKEKKRQDSKIALARLKMMFDVMNGVTYGRMDEYMKNIEDINKISIYPSKHWR